MSFKLFIYYCALCGGWAAFLTAVVVLVTGINALSSAFKSTVLIAAILGVLVAAAVGTVDAILNAVGIQRIVRALACLGIGLVGGLVGGAIGQVLRRYLALPGFLLGWMILGVTIGASVGVYDLVRARHNRQASALARRKTLNGIMGGAVGGLVGGLLFWVLQNMLNYPRFSLATGLVVLGASIGLLIGLAQVILKEAWVKIEAGFRAGREMMLSKAETTIGRAESCDIGLFGDPSIDKAHARIVMQGSRYLLEHVGTTGTTLLNNSQVTRPTALTSGDLIRVGNSVLRFGERRKQPGTP